MNEEIKRPGKIILSWWHKHLRPNPELETGTLRAFRARLRRADRASDVMIEPESLQLYEDLRTASERYCRDPLVLAALLPVLAHVEVHNPDRVARAFGVGDPPALSRMRFQKLIRLDDIDALAKALRRSLPLINDTCNVAALGDDFLHWQSDDERVRTRWCFDYFGKSWPTSAKKNLDTEGLT